MNCIALTPKNWYCLTWQPWGRSKLLILACGIATLIFHSLYAMEPVSDPMRQGIKDAISQNRNNPHGFLKEITNLLEIGDKFCTRESFHEELQRCLRENNIFLSDIKNLHTGRLVLHCACEMKSLESAKFIIEHAKEDFDLYTLLIAQDTLGHCSLHEAVFAGELDIVKELMQTADRCHIVGIMLNIKDIYHKTAIERAKDWEKPEILEYLQPLNSEYTTTTKTKKSRCNIL